MKKKVIISNCTRCPYYRQAGPFGEVAYEPLCVNVSPGESSRVLPYTMRVSPGGTHVNASPTDVIPEWCKLEDST
jgi:hypothetical protein